MTNSDTSEERPWGAIPPVPCPRCGEAQNTMPGGFRPAAVPFGPVSCIVCGHEFTRDQYMAALDEIAERRAGTNVIPFRAN